VCAWLLLAVLQDCSLLDVQRYPNCVVAVYGIGVCAVGDEWYAESSVAIGGLRGGFYLVVACLSCNWMWCCESTEVRGQTSQCQVSCKSVQRFSSCCKGEGRTDREI
jgi:hypothetical protein